MKFKTHNDKDISVGGTHRQGQIITTYRDIVNTFGKPSKDYDDYKSDAEWNIEFENGMVATLYNYKNGINYLGRKEGIPKTKITEWNIGGVDKTVVSLIQLAIIQANN